MIERHDLPLDEAFNRELVNLILERAATEPSQPSWIRGGWRSDVDVLRWPSPLILKLHELVCEAFYPGRVTTRKWIAWATVNRNGSHHARHVHGGERTGIYYATTGSGRITFELPNGFESVTPVAGLLLIAPSQTYHSVEPCIGPEPRVAIGFEVI
jgi:hypothetical protein